MRGVPSCRRFNSDSCARAAGVFATGRTSSRNRAKFHPVPYCYSPGTPVLAGCGIQWYEVTTRRFLRQGSDALFVLVVSSVRRSEGVS